MPTSPAHLSDPAGGVGRATEPATADLESALRPAWVDVDLDALTDNLAVLRQTLGAARAMAVVKADAYGHGAVAVSRALEGAGVDHLGVALLEEGAEIRRAGVELPILVLGTARPAKLALYRHYRLTPTISSLEELALWREWADTGHPQPCHLKVDTGMSRLGIALGEVSEALTILRSGPQLELCGILSHFAEADDLASPRNAVQEDRFAGVLEQLTPAERERVLVHMANSAAALYRPRARHDLVRLGIALYGLDPAAPAAPETPENTGVSPRVERNSTARRLVPVMAVRARIVQLREVPAGTSLSYGGRMVTRRRSEIAVAPVGYADGYSWRLGLKAEALVRGERVPVAGSVTMDMTLLDVTGLGARIGEEVVLLGRQGREEITASELARHAETIAWEILCHLGLRLPRRYWRDGRVEELVSRFSREES
jgi:alanine racemase